MAKPRPDDQIPDDPIEAVAWLEARIGRREPTHEELKAKLCPEAPEAKNDPQT
jgi:hypothetical protein